MELYDWAGQTITNLPTRIVPSVSAVILNAEGQLLLQLRADNGYWSLPGGKVEILESVEQAVIREVFEETGLNVIVKRLVGVYSDPKNYTIASYPNSITIHYVNICFECVVQNGMIRGSEEGTQVRFVALASLPDNILLAHRLRIQDALKNQESAFIR